MFSFKKRKNFLVHKKYKIERQSVKYRNPWSLRKGLLGSKLFKVINLFLIIGILGCLYFFIFSNFYNITNIEISGNQIISTDDMLDLTGSYLSVNKLFIFKNRNIFLFNKNEFKNKVEEVILLSDLKIEKVLPNTIRLTLKEKNAAIKWITNNQEYLADNNGQIIKRYYKLTMPKIFSIIEQAPIESQATNDNFIKVTNSANDEVNLGDKVLRPEDVLFILDLQKALSAKDYLQPQSLTVPNNWPKYISVGLNNGTKIYFNLTDSLETQINRLNLIIDQKIKKSNLSGVDYIDLRLGESVYYKMK
ncbi:MAG: FtsQ-type POTRA domain-containing protein [Patescibacteria group bacterium]